MVNEPTTVIQRFDKQHYIRLFNPKTGFFARIEEPGYPEPLWSTSGPELLDISITNWCDRECSFCYQKSGTTGQHMSFNDYELILNQAQQMRVLQVALGGGNPNQHPEFVEFLRLARLKYGIVPNYTTNGRGLSSDVLKASREFCGAVAVSAYEPYLEAGGAIKLLLSNDIRTNVHFILDNQSINTAVDWLENAPNFIEGVNALIFLNYKPIGRSVYHDRLLRQSNQLERFFVLATGKRHPFKIGFDSCLATGLRRYTNVPRMCYESCDASRFSMFVSENLRMYPCSFMAQNGFEGVAMTECRMQACWQESVLFTETRSKLMGGRCTECQGSVGCLGGCPIFPEINLCSQYYSATE